MDVKRLGVVLSFVGVLLCNTLLENPVLAGQKGDAGHFEEAKMEPLTHVLTVMEAEKTITPAHLFEYLTKTVHEGPAPDPGKPEELLLKKGTIRLSGNANYWFLESPELVASIEKKTGLLHSLQSLKPNPVISSSTNP